jgi:hypothetical protein
MFKFVVFPIFPNFYFWQGFAQSCIKAKKSKHLNNHGENMHAVEIFGSDGCFQWMMFYVSTGIFSEELFGDGSLAV